MEPKIWYGFFGSHAVFNCTMNNTEYHLNNMYAYPNGIPQDVTVSGSVTSVTGALLLTKDNNGTEVVCIATPAVLGRPPISTILRLFISQTDTPDGIGGCSVVGHAYGQGMSVFRITL